jgi:hypothetical protein
MYSYVFKLVAVQITLQWFLLILVGGCDSGDSSKAKERLYHNTTLHTFLPHAREVFGCKHQYVINVLAWHD